MQNKKIYAEEIENIYQNVAELCRDMDIATIIKAEYLQDLAEGLVNLHSQVAEGKIIEPAQLSNKLLEIEDKTKGVRDYVDIPHSISKYKNTVIKMVGDAGNLARKVTLKNERRLYSDMIEKISQISFDYIETLKRY